MTALRTPRVLAYDLELFEPIPEGDHGPRWSQAPQCGISVLAAWASWEDDPRVYVSKGQDRGRSDTERFVDAVVALDPDVGLLTWNGLDFDDAVIRETLAPMSAAQVAWTYQLEGRRRIDLAIIAGLCEKAQSKGVDGFRAAVTALLAGGVPMHYPTLIGYSPNARVNVKKGWNLEATCTSTFGVERSKSMHGAEAPLAWQQGRFGEVVGYCVGDTLRTLRLWRHAVETGELRSGPLTAKIPRTAL